ncbi:MAG: HD domain-containing phosphohydrolase [Wenzhouxiangella sp.]
MPPIGLALSNAGEHQIRTIPDQLKLGHMVARTDIAWSKTPYPDPTGMLLENAEQKQWLVDHCRWVIIDLRRSRNAFRPPARYADPLYEPVPSISDPIRTFQDKPIGPAELRRAWQIHRALDEQTAALLRTFEDEMRLDMPAVHSVVAHLAEEIEDCLAGLIWLTRIKDAEHYTAQHVVNTAILSMGLVYGMGWSRERMETAGLVGMLHDIGKARLDHDLLDKTGPLSPAEVNEVRRHVIVGYELLRTNKDVPLEVRSAVRSSHERIDGSGYPRGLKGDAIPVMARLIAVLDAYDAITSFRPHGAAQSHQRALGELWRARGKQFEAVLVEAFIQFLGWVPPGTLVRLEDGSLAVVMNMRARTRQRPVVRRIQRLEGQLTLADEREVAARFEPDDGGRVSISEILPDGAENISMRSLTGALMRLYEAGQADPAPVGASSANEQQAALAQSSRWRLQSLRKLFRGDSPPETEAGVEPVTASAALRRRILVIDESSSERERLVHILSQAGHEVEAAASGEQGLARARAQVPELIFLDILLPDTNGFAVLKALRQEPAMADVPVIMISDSAEASEQFFRDRGGADDFLPKPLTPEDVTDCLARLAPAGRADPVAADR